MSRAPLVTKDDKSKCDPDEVAMKSFFLGPRAENGEWLYQVVGQIFADWFRWRRERFSTDGAAISLDDQAVPEFQAKRAAFERGLRELLVRYESEMPKHSPRYLGHMFSEIALPALLGHVVALLHNPNNISGESSVVGVEIEEEAIRELSRMVGFGEGDASGHFTSGGTIANFEALVRARERMETWLGAGAVARGVAGAGGLFEAAHSGWDGFKEALNRIDDARGRRALDEFRRAGSNAHEFVRRIERAYSVDWAGPVVLVPSSKHYSWIKGVSLLGMGAESLWQVDLDEKGRLSVPSLEAAIARARAAHRPVLMVVTIAGTTEMGAVDPIDQVHDLLERLRVEEGIHIWHHVDAAYGGFFRSITELGLCSPHVTKALGAIATADSVTLDPHKLGYVPYSCGAFVMRSQRDYFIKSYLSPYLATGGRDRGPHTLEGSRSAAGATATWMCAKTVGFDGDGYGRILGRTIRMRAALEKKMALRKASHVGAKFRVAPHADTNVLCFTYAAEGGRVTEANAAAEKIFRAFSPRGRTRSERRFYVSRTTLSWKSYGAYLDRFVASWKGVVDAEGLTLVRLCMLNPFFDSRVMEATLSGELIESVEALFSAPLGQ